MAVERIMSVECIQLYNNVCTFNNFLYGYTESDSPKRIGKRVTKIGLVVSGPEAMPCARMSRPMAMVGFRMTRRMMKMTKHGTC